MPTHIKKIILSRRELSEYVTSIVKEFGEGLKSNEILEFDKLEYSAASNEFEAHFTIVDTAVKESTPLAMVDRKGIEIKSLS